METSTRNGPIFVVGAPRSGTTLLQRMLRSHPRISSPTGESHFIVPLLRNAPAYGSLAERANIRAVLGEMHRINAEFMETDFHGLAFDLDAIAGAIHTRGVATMPALIDALFRLNAEGEGKARWLEKTPYYIMHVDALLAAFPSAQFVHIIRDGRDAVLSMLERAEDIRVFNVDAGARLWRRYVEAGQAAGRRLPAGRYYEIRYEDILAAPQEAVKGLCDYLGEPVSDKVIDFQKSSDPATKTPLLRQGLQAGNREKWRKAMTPRQIRVFEGIAGECLAACGYPLSTAPHDPGALEGAVYRIHNRVMERLRPHPKQAR